jgi:hypothetical protein
LISTAAFRTLAESCSATCRELGADVLAMLCALMPGEMVALAMKDVERQMREPMSLSERPKRVAELEAELDRLGYIEERLIADGGR